MLMTIMDGLMKLEERYDFVMKKKKKKRKIDNSAKSKKLLDL